MGVSLRGIRRCIYGCLVGEAIGGALVILGGVMFAMPIGEALLFEVWIGSLDVAPAIVGVLGAVVWRAFVALRHHYLAMVDHCDRELYDELRERQRCGQENEPEFVKRIRDATSFQSLRQRTVKLVFFTGLAFFLVATGGAASAAVWCHWDSGCDDAIVFGALAVFCMLGLIRHVADRPRPS